jgi:RNA polymerase sigma factor (sigma-70 family)
MLGGHDAADEALQTAFVRAFQSLNRWKETDQFSDWLFRLVISECRARALRRVVRERQGTGEFAAIGQTSRPLAEDAEAMQRVIDQIDPAIREPFVLLYVEELPYARIAALTGAPIQTLERQVDRACARLRELIPATTNETHLSRAGMELLSSTPAPSLAVQVAMPLRRPEVLNDSFEDRLMAKLLRSATPAGAGSSEVPTGTADPASPLPPLPPSPWTSHESGHPWAGRRMYLAIAGVAGCLAFASFVAGYAARRWRDVRDVERRRPSKAAIVTRVVRRTDTVRVVRGDTIVLARFAFVDAAARSVALIGDFNDWNPSATPLHVGSSRGSWSTVVWLAPGRYEYAFLVDGKRWATDPFTRATYAAWGGQSSVIALGSNDPAVVEDASGARTRLKKVLPHDVADRMLTRIASLKEQGGPAGTLEQRALELATKKVTAKEIERAIAADADRLVRSRRLLSATPHNPPSAREVIAGAEVLRRGGDSAAVLDISRAVPARRSVGVPLEVVAQLVAGGMNAEEAAEKVHTRLHNDASDAALERWADETVARLANRAPEQGKSTRVAKHAGGTTEVRQAGAPQGSGKRKKGSDTPHRP